MQLSFREIIMSTTDYWWSKGWLMINYNFRTKNKENLYDTQLGFFSLCSSRRGWRDTDSRDSRSGARDARTRRPPAIRRTTLWCTIYVSEVAPPLFQKYKKKMCIKTEHASLFLISIYIYVVYPRRKQACASRCLFARCWCSHRFHVYIIFTTPYVTIIIIIILLFVYHTQEDFWSRSIL